MNTRFELRGLVAALCAALLGPTAAGAQVVHHDRSGATGAGDATLQPRPAVQVSYQDLGSETSPPAAEIVVLTEPAIGDAYGPVWYGDTDSDGVPDAVFVTAPIPLDLHPHLAIAHGKGNGLFDQPVHLDDGFVNVLPLVDMNGDGYSDVVTWSPSDSGLLTSVTIYLSDGHGHLGLKVESIIAMPPTNTIVTTVDMDGDGVQDVVGTGDVPILWIAHGNGDGSVVLQSLFDLPYFYPASPPLAVSDFNGDGIVDVATGNGEADDTIDVFLGLGAGVLATEPLVSPGSQPGQINFTTIHIAAGDVDADGVPDLGFVARLWSSTAGYAAVFHGRGDATFAQVDVETLVASGPCATQDVNGDGLADLVVGNGIGYGLSMLLAGTTPPFDVVELAAETTAAPPQIVDVNGDGNLDIAVNTSLILGQPDGVFQACIHASLGKHPVDVHLADLNGDGHLDVLGALSGSVTLGTMFGDGSGSFDTANVLDFGEGAVGAAADDVNGDGFPDVALSSPSGITVRLNNGTGLDWSAAIPLDNVPAGSPQIADIDGDGNRDVLAMEPSGKLVVFLGDGQGDFSGAMASMVGVNGDDIALTDFDVDGLIDAALTRSDSEGIARLHGVGGGFFGLPETTEIQLASDASLAAADLNADGLPDCATAAEGLFNVNIAVFIAATPSSFEPPAIYPAGGTLTGMAADDLDRDDHCDLVEGRDGYRVGVLRGLGNGAFQPERFYAAAGQVHDLAIGDLDGDGLNEVVTTIGDGKGFTVLGNRTTYFPSLGFENDAGFGLAHLEGVGVPEAKAEVSLSASGVPSRARGMLLAGLAFVPLSFHGGTLVPSLDVVLPMRTDSPLTGRWPSLDPNTQLYFQAWFDVDGKLAGSNALVATGQ